MSELILSGMFVVVACFLIYLARPLFEFRWLRALRGFQFSVATLLSVTATFAIALGIYRLQAGTKTLLALPFPAILVFCFFMLGLVVTLRNEFGSRRHQRRTSTLESYRDRHETLISPPAETTSEVPPKTRRKWWLRRMPNRFRSISYREFQDTPSANYYDDRS